MSKALVVAEKQHATLGASTANRWMNCPGSVALSEGMPNVSSVYAEEGTAAHALAELSLRGNHTHTFVDPHTFVGTTIEGMEVDEDMADNVGVYVDYVRQFRQIAGAPTWVESKFNLALLNPPAPMFGTADFVAYDPRNRQLHVVDLKYGQGVVVEVKGNKQLRYYALGALLAHSDLQVDTIEITVVQPRALHPDGFIRSETVAYEELIGFAGDLLDAARRTQEPDAPLVTGSHCRFCAAIAICPAKHAEAQSIAQTEFSAMPAAVPPAPDTLPPEVFADVLAKAPILEAWLTAMRAEAMRRLERGEEVQGFKLVAKRATRKFTDGDDAIEYLKASGFNEDEIVEKKIKSPAQIEKLFPKKKMPSELQVAKVSSGYVMVPVHDKREAVILSASHEFVALPGADSHNTEGERNQSNEE